jgi:ABC-2 type transport system ATP-binding protein
VRQGRSPFAFVLSGVPLLGAALLIGLPATGDAAVSTPVATALGVLTGAVLFRGFAGVWPDLGGLRRERGGIIAVRSTYLTVRSALEELAWRGFVLGVLARTVTAVPALLLSSIGFALAHASIVGRQKLVHVATGAAFGSVYLLTGRLASAISAHAVYNVLIGLAVEADGDTPRPPTRSFASAELGTAADSTNSVRHGPADSVIAELRNVHKRYGETQALAGVSLELAPGEILALLGPNGAGKTTAVSILLGTKRPDLGTAALFGSNPTTASARTSIGAAPQEIAFPPALRVREVVDLVRAHFDDPEPRETLLDRFDLSDQADRQAGGLSGGQKRRLAVALAFAGRPRVVFLDEPTAGLDVEARRALLASLHAYSQTGGTILLTTHQLDEAEALATRVVVLDRGEILAEGGVEAIKQMGGFTCVKLRIDELPQLRNVDRVERSADVARLYTRDAPALVNELVGLGVELTGLEVRPLSLEEAFLSLTGKGQSP